MTMKIFSRKLPLFSAPSARALVATVFLCALAFTPQLPSGPNNKGTIYAELGRLAAGKAWPQLEARAAAALAEHNAEVGFMRYHVWALREQAKHETAVASARGYLKQNPTEAALRSLLGATLTGAGQAQLATDPARAAQLLAEALELDATKPYVHNLYGQALIASGQLDQAIAHLEKSCDRFPTDGGLRFRLDAAFRARRAALRKEAGPSMTQDLLALAERAGSRGLRATSAYGERAFIRFAAGILVDLRAKSELLAYIGRLKERHPNDSYVFHLSAGFFRRLYDRDQARFKEFYDLALADRNAAIRLYEREHPDRAPLSGLTLPLRGTVLVINAVETTYTHHGYNKYCYDFIGTDESGNILRPGSAGEKVDDYIGFGGAIRAVLGGHVDSVDNHFDDLPIGRQSPEDNNQISIKHADGTIAVYFHNKKKSARVRRGTTVQSGTQIAEVGNSGWTMSPHLHFCVYDKNRVSLPLRFVGVSVKRPGTDAWVAHSGPYEKWWLLRAE